MTLDIYKFDESILGAKTPDPLRFAFAKKSSAHAGGMAAPVPPPQGTQVLKSLLSKTEGNTKQRCLYVHIPFCRVRCTFCNFFQNAASRQLVDDYFAALMTELKQKAAQPWTQSGSFNAVYIGGGTPTDLSAQQIKLLGNAIRQHFPLAPDCEITLEGRMNRFSDEMFDSALEGGFNRFSFGVQSFDTQVRRKAKRLDDRDVVMKRLSDISATDEAPIIIDLLYGLPYQTMEVFEQDLYDYLETGAHGVDLYQLGVGGTAPMIQLVEKGRLPPPATTPEKAAMYELGVNFMKKHHLKTLSVNHWAIDNRERSLYNSLAKTYAEILPLGCGAGGNIGGYSMMHHRSLETYMDALNSGKSAVAMLMKQHQLSPLFAALKAGFDSGVVRRGALPQLDYNEFNNKDCFDYLTPLFEVWQQRGLATLEQDYLVLTLAGRFWNVSLAQGAIQVLQRAHQPVTPPVSAA